MPSLFVRHFSAVRLLVAFALLQTLVGPALGQFRSPPPPPPAAKKSVGSPPPPPPPPAATAKGSSTAAKKPAWGNKADAAPDNDGVRRLVPIDDHDTKLIFAPAPSAMVAVNNGEADGIVFVADSQRARLDANLESLANLNDNLREHGRQLQEVPHAIAYNKRDLYDLVSVEELERQLACPLRRLAAPDELLHSHLEMKRELIVHIAGGVWSEPAPEAIPV